MPSPLPIHELANIVPRANLAEQEALNHSIASRGYQTSLGNILLWQGAICDGRNRQEACLKANLDPRDYTIELSTTNTYEEVESLIFSANTRRNLSDTQKTITAYRTSTLKGHTRESSSKQWGVPVRQMAYVASITKTLQKVSQVSNIIYYGISTSSGVKFYPFRGTPTNSVQGHFSEQSANALLDRLSDDCSIRVLLQDGIKTSTKSVKVVAQRLKLLLEEQSLIVEEEDTIQWNPDSQITTEAGKHYYYTTIENLDLPVRIKIELANYANLKYRLPSIAEPSHSQP